MAGYVVLGILLALFFAAVTYFNRLTALKNQVGESWSGIEVQLKRRYDLIPALVEVVKGYMQHEQSAVEKVVQARARAMGAGAPGDKAAADDIVSGALKNIFAISEGYPDLKASQNFLELQRDLSKVEEDIQQSRRYFNAVVRDFNTAQETFPSVIVAKLMGLQRSSYFQASAEEQANVKLDFGSRQ